MTLEHVMLSLCQLVLNLRQLPVDMIGTSIYLHVNIPPNYCENTLSLSHTRMHTQTLTEPEETTHHDKLHVLTHAHFSPHRCGFYTDTSPTLSTKGQMCL